MHKQCPITAGCPTRMSKESFLAACAAKRWVVATHYGAAVFRCGECKGRQLPPELELTDLTQKSTEASMAIKRIGAGRCQSCGKTKITVSEANEMLMCASCLSAYTAVRQRIKVVAAAIKKTGQVEEAAMLLGLDQAPPATAAPAEPVDFARLAEELGGPEALIARMVDEYGADWLINASKSHLPEQIAVEIESDFMRQVARTIGYEGESGQGLLDAVEKLARYVHSDQNVYWISAADVERLRSAFAPFIMDGNHIFGGDAESKPMLGDLAGWVEFLAGRLQESDRMVGELEDRNRALDSDLAEKKKMVAAWRTGTYPSSPLPCTHSLDSHLLDLALDAWRGKITGIDPDRIAVLREAA